LNPKSIGLDSVEDYYFAKFRVIPIRGLPFMMLTTPTHSPTNTHTMKKSSQYRLY